MALAQPGSDYVVPRTEYGQPDFQGVWNFASNIPMERPNQYVDQEYLSEEEVAENQERAVQTFEQGLSSGPGVGGYNSYWYERAGRGDNLRTSLIVYPENGKIPEVVEGAYYQLGSLGVDIPGERPMRALFGGISKDGPEDRGLSERCIVGFNAGPPFVPSGYNNNVQFIQHEDTIVIMTEMVHDARIVPLDDTPHIDDSIRQWSGDSRGYWEGETLVVETRNFTGISQSFKPVPYGDDYDKIITERFTRVDLSTMSYEFTLDDPGTFTDKIVGRIPMSLVDGLLYEYACHEGNYGMMNTLRGARWEESNLTAGSEESQ
ncbi:MAG: hypothetical protein CMQ15_00555 [Gammaproteobacteria bacterium]|nr:hypothetical protein [Gammaproteobacteria bacterium]